MSNLPDSIQKEIDGKRKIIGATKIEQERWRKKNIGETEERLDAIGNRSEKVGIKATQEAYKQHRDEEFMRKSDRIAWLNRKAKYSKGKRLEYYKNVEILLLYEIEYLKLPIGYRLDTEVTIEGIKIVLRDRWDGIHIGGFKPCGLGLYDEQACRSSINKVDDFITQLENDPKDGIYLP